MLTKAMESIAQFTALNIKIIGINRAQAIKTPTDTKETDSAEPTKVTTTDVNGYMITEITSVFINYIFPG